MTHSNLTFPLLLSPLMFNNLLAPAVAPLVLCLLLVFLEDCALSTREEPVGLRHLVPVFLIRAYGPAHSHDAGNDGAHDSCVGPPVGWLRIPTTSGRPDVFWVPGIVRIMSSEQLECYPYGIFPPPPIVKSCFVVS